MMPEHNPLKVPAALKGDADPETLAGLVSSSRRMGLFWPVLATSSRLPRPGAPRRAGITVPPRAASVVADMAEYGD